MEGVKKAMYRYRLVFVKEGEFIFLSHLDLQRTFIRVLRRAGLPLSYSQGFNPQPRLSFAAPLAVGIASTGEYLEFDLFSPREENNIKEALNALLPAELTVQRVEPVDHTAPFLTSQVEAALYLATVSPPNRELPAAVQSIMAAAALEVERQGKKGKKSVNVRPFIYKLCLQNTFEEDKLFMFLATGNQGGTRPAEIVDLLPLQHRNVHVRRLSVFISGNGDYLTPDGESVAAFLQRWL